MKGDISTINQIPGGLQEGDIKVDDGVLDLTDGDVSILAINSHIDLVVGS